MKSLLLMEKLKIKSGVSEGIKGERGIQCWSSGYSEEKCLPNSLKSIIAH